MDDFIDYLKRKKIDPARLQQELPEEWARMLAEFAAAGEKAFDQQKKFLLNPLRLEFPFTEES